MTKTLTTLVLLVLSLSALRAQGDLPIEESIDKWSEAAKQQIVADQIFYVGNLASRWKDADDKQKKEIQNLAVKNLKSRDKDVRTKTIESLGLMVGGKRDAFSDMSAKILTAELNKKHTEEDLSYFAAILDSLGRTQSRKATATLEKQLNYKEFSIIAAAASAMAHFREADIKIRRPLVEEILKTYTGAYNAHRADQRNTTAKDKYEAIRGAMEASLKALTGQKLEGSVAWWDWWNDTGKKATDW